MYKRQLQATLEYNSARWASNTVQLAGYTVAGLKARWEPLKGLSLEVGGDNLADKLYELDAGFPSAGRSWYANVRHEF